MDKLYKFIIKYKKLSFILFFSIAILLGVGYGIFVGWIGNKVFADLIFMVIATPVCYIVSKIAEKIGEKGE